MKKVNVQKLVGLAILTAVIVVLQLFASAVKIGPVETSFVLIPIVVGAAMYGPIAGLYLGGVFAVVVLLQPGTAYFYQFSVVGTVLTVIVKGMTSGFVSGLVYRCLAKKNEWLAVILAAVVCPLVNTGLFLLGARIFFWDDFAREGGGNAFIFVFTVLIGWNFIAEFVTNLLCAPAVIRILHVIKKQK